MGSGIDDRQARWLLDFLSAQLRGHGGAANSPAASAAPEWDLISKYASNSGTLPIIGWALRDSEIADVPVSIREHAASRYANAHASAVALQGEVIRLAKVFREYGVEPVFVRKGIYTSALYPAPGLRSSADVDLLVPPSAANIARVRAALGVAGYEPLPLTRAQQVRYRAATGAQVPYVMQCPPGSPFERFGVDITHAIAPPQVRSEFAPTSAFETLGREVSYPIYGLHDEALFLDLCISLFVTNVTAHYIRRGRQRRLALYLDLLLLLRASPGVTRCAMELCPSDGLRVAVSFALGNLCRLFPDVTASLSPALLEHAPGSLDVVGHLEQGELLPWNASLLERIFGTPPLPVGLPADPELLP